MKITDIVKRTPKPEPWVEGDKIPWNDPDFSERMLREPLTQDHDLASRRTAIVDGQVAWIHDHMLGGKPGKVLDLGCGPGLYASRLAKTATTRFFVIDAATGQVEQMNQTMRAYTNQDYERMLTEAGLTQIEFPTSFGVGDDPQNDMLMIIAAMKDAGAQK